MTEGKRDYTAMFAHIKAAEPFKVGAKVKHKDDVGTDKEGQVYEITVEHGYSKMWLDPYRVCSYEDLILVEEAVSTYDKLINTFVKLEVPNDTEVTFTYDEGTDVMHYTGDAEENAVGETSTINRLIEISRCGMTLNEDLIDDMRDQGHLDEYERGSYDFEGYCTETVAENFYDYDDYISTSIEQYDHKRGFCTVTATVTTTVQNIIDSAEPGDDLAVGGWKASFDSPSGSMTIDI